MATRILLADDHEIVLEGIRTLVAKSGRAWEICGEARNGEEAVEMVKALKPDVAVLDITMPGKSGLEAAKIISKLGTTCRVLIFTMHESGRLGIEARECGAHGYVLKAQAARDLIRAIDYLLAGSNFFGTPPEEEKRREEKQKPGGIFLQAFGYAW